MNKKLFSQIIFIFLFLWFAFPNALNAQVQISAGPAIAVNLGKYDEYVYSFSGRSIVSKLEWQQLPLIKLGALCQACAGNFVFSSDFFYALPFQCGKMYDSDWNHYGTKTTYSISNNYAKQNYSFSFEGAYKIKLKNLCFVPSLCFDYSYDFFQSNQGHGWYGSESYSKTKKDVSWDSENATYFKKLSRIDLIRQDWYVFAGLGLCFDVNDYFKLKASTYISPFAGTTNKDYHHDDTGKNEDFHLDSSQSSSFARFKESLGVEYNINDAVQIFINATLLFGGIQKGQLEGQEQNAGTDVFLTQIKIGLIFTSAP